MSQNNTENEECEMAAATLCHDVSFMLQKAFDSRNDISVEDIASKLSVPTSRVVEILSLSEEETEASTGNIKISGFARYMRSLGYKVEMYAVAQESQANADAINRKRSVRPIVREGYQQEYNKTLLGWSANVLAGTTLDSPLPFNEYISHMIDAGFTAKDVIEFVGNAVRQTILIPTNDGSLYLKPRG